MKTEKEEILNKYQQALESQINNMNQETEKFEEVNNTNPMSSNINMTYSNNNTSFPNSNMALNPQATNVQASLMNGNNFANAQNPVSANNANTVQGYNNLGYPTNYSRI